MILSSYINNNLYETDSIMYNIIGEQSKFDDLEEYFDSNINPFYICSKSSVRISAYMPTSGESKISCMFEFKSFRISDCYITFGNDDILKRLFVGIKQYNDLTQRGFVISKAYDNKTDYIIQFPNNRFILAKEELYELCQIVDKLYNRYIKIINNIEKSFDSHLFKKEYQGYKLIGMKRVLWQELKQFIFDNEKKKIILDILCLEIIQFKLQSKKIILLSDKHI